MIKKIITLLLLSILFIQCKPPLPTDFNFLLGSWKMETSDSTYIIEKWNKIDSLNYEGLAYNISPNGMELSEELKIELSENEINYIPILGHTDLDNPIKFKLVSTEDGQYIFENKENDFPTQITYKQINDTTLHASLIDSIGHVATIFKYQKIAE
jgi:hypothetical protein